MRWKTSKNEKREKQVAERLRRSSKFYVFLWSIREELFSKEFEDELIAAYQPRGQEPCAPAMLAMVMLLQRYAGLSDAAAVDQAENDLRWQLVLGTLGKERAPFGQGSLVRFRTRAIAHDLDKKLVDRTVELAKQTKKFGWKQLRVAFDSSPLEGAGRVEDTWNLIGRAMAKLTQVVAKALDVDVKKVIESAGLSVLGGSSVKASLDIDWGDDDERHEALQRLIGEAERLEKWVVKHLSEDADKPPVSDALHLLRRVVDQDLEPDPEGGGKRIREGVAHERIISIGDPEMRHGRKSRSKTINGFKRHIVIANKIILGAAVEPANKAEALPTGRLLDTARRHGELHSAHFDRGYLPAPEVAELWRAGVELHSRAYNTDRDGSLGKQHFKLQLKDGIVICPMGKLALISPKTNIAHFNKNDCGRCSLKANCTTSPRRTIRLHENEPMLLAFRAEQATRSGRLRYRDRTVVEHRLGRVAAVQGPKARYRGVRKNELDLRRAAAVINLQEISLWRQAA